MTKPHDADAWSASTICPRLNNTIISNAVMPGIMIACRCHKICTAYVETDRLGADF
jgi:hypothetical protein